MKSVRPPRRCLAPWESLAGAVPALPRGTREDSWRPEACPQQLHTVCRGDLPRTAPSAQPGVCFPSGFCVLCVCVVSASPTDFTEKP